MKKKILIIGRKSFISFNLAKDLKNTFVLKILSLENFFQLDDKKLLGFDYIINCTLNKNYVNRKYQASNDFDLKIIDKIKNFNIRYIFLSTRKVYKLGNNLKESSKTQPQCNYSKNKLITEKKLIKLLKKKILILRISNIIGAAKDNNNRKVHNTFIYQFFSNIKKQFIYDNGKKYKDFLSTSQFSKILEKLIKKKSHGIFNVSIGKKVYLKELISWLNYYNEKKYRYINLPNNLEVENFYLSNLKLIKEIKLKINLTKLEKDCKRISKLYFKK